jgi:NAD(P)H-hydrate epimerase
MRVVTPAQMSEIDAKTIKDIGIPGAVLMENAALKVVEEAIKSLGSVSGKYIVLLAGKGNNGGDAFAVARHLYNKGAIIKLFVVAKTGDINNDAALNMNILSNMGINITEITEEKQVSGMKPELNHADMIIDGIFGTGFKGEARGVIKAVMEAVNITGKYVLSIDIPSGVNGETGSVSGTCIKACKTVTFGLPKVGLLVFPGCDYVGQLVVADISIPENVIGSMNINLNTIDEIYVSRVLPGRRSESNKGDYGKVLILSGSIGMAGSGCLSARAALRAGTGLAYLGVPASLVNVYNSLMAEAVVVPFEDYNKGFISKDGVGYILERMEKMDVVAVGPGLSTNEGIYDVVKCIVENSEIPLVLDADALNVLSKDVSLLKKLKTEAVITPHPGEMARLLGISIKDVQNNRIKVAQDFAREYKVITVLKGARTIVAFPEGSTFINTTGNPGMATAGMGDVLTGIIASLIGQGVKPGDAAIAGVYLHGAAADSIAARMGEHGIIAGDIVEELPYTIKALIK